MKIVNEKKLSEFHFWSDAKKTAAVLTEQDFDQLEFILEDLYPEGMSETAINDLFWFEEDTLAEWLGYKDFESLKDLRT